MRKQISSEQITRLLSIWRENGGLAKQEDAFISGLQHTLSTMPPIIEGSKGKIEIEESNNYADVEKCCSKLIRALRVLPLIERTSLLSIHERRDDFGGKAVPMIDPLEYVDSIQELASGHSQYLRTFRKHVR
jgi:hypothetical protein